MGNPFLRSVTLLSDIYLRVLYHVLRKFFEQVPIHFVEKITLLFLGLKLEIFMVLVGINLQNLSFLTKPTHLTKSFQEYFFGSTDYSVSGYRSIDSP